MDWSIRFTKRFAILPGKLQSKIALLFFPNQQHRSIVDHFGSAPQIDKHVSCQFSLAGIDLQSAISLQHWRRVHECMDMGRCGVLTNTCSMLQFTYMQPSRTHIWSTHARTHARTHATMRRQHKHALGFHVVCNHVFFFKIASSCSP